MLAFCGDGEMRARLRSHDWSGFALGPPQAWPVPLKTALQMMLDSRRPSCLAWGPALHFFYNDAYREILGDKHPAALLRPFWSVWPELEKRMGPAVQRTLKGQSSLQKDMPLRLVRQGYLENVWFTFSLLPIREEDGQVGGVFSLMAETTEQIEVQQCHRFLLGVADRLRPLGEPDQITAQACRMLGRYLRASRVFYSEVDGGGETFFIREDWTNAGQASVAGQTRRLDDFGPEVIDTLRAGKPVTVTDVNEDPRTAPYAEAYRAIGLRAYLVVPLVKSDRLISLLSVHSPTPRRWTRRDLYLSQELIERTWAAAENVRAQAELRKAVERLKAADAHKDVFMAMLAHELKNPLAPICSASELLSRAPLDEGLVRHSSQIIGRQAERMNHLIEGLLDVSRVTQGLVALEKEPLDMRHVVRVAVEQVSPLIHAKRHQLAWPLPPGPAMVMGDEHRLVQVVANLLTNAAKYTPEGGRLRLTTQVCQGAVVLELADNGIGMQPELAEHAFDLFSQAERTSEGAAGGLGLGLALVKSLVELHGGTVTCASEGVGKGSVFTVSLPQLT